MCGYCWHFLTYFVESASSHSLLTWFWTREKKHLDLKESFVFKLKLEKTGKYYLFVCFCISCPILGWTTSTCGDYWCPYICIDPDVFSIGSDECHGYKYIFQFWPEENGSSFFHIIFSKTYSCRIASKIQKKVYVVKERK